jgi:hypothetical protein
MRTAKMLAIVDIYRASTVRAQSTQGDLLHVEEPIRQLTVSAQHCSYTHERSGEENPV